MYTCRGLLLRQILAEERPDLVPPVHALLGPVQRAVPVEEAMPGAVVAVEFAILVVLFQLGLMLVHLLRARRTVVVAEQPQDRATQVFRHVDRRDGLFRVEFLL